MNPATKNPPLSIQQQGLIRSWQTHMPCVQLSGESAGLLEQEVGECFGLVSCLRHQIAPDEKTSPQAIQDLHSEFVELFKEAGTEVRDLTTNRTDTQ